MIGMCEICDRRKVPVVPCYVSQRMICYRCNSIDGDVDPDPYCKIVDLLDELSNEIKKALAR